MNAFYEVADLDCSIVQHLCLVVAIVLFGRHSMEEDWAIRWLQLDSYLMNLSAPVSSLPSQDPTPAEVATI